MKWSLLREQGCHKVTAVPSPPVCCCLIVALWWRWGGLETGCWQFGNMILSTCLVIKIGWPLLFPFSPSCTYNICFEPEWRVLLFWLEDKTSVQGDSSSVQIFSTSSSVFNCTWIILMTFWLRGWLLTSSQCLNCEYRFLWL